jgi:hypothetical protein
MSHTNTLNIYDRSMDHGFNDEQARHLVFIAEQIPPDNTTEVISLKNSIIDTKETIVEIKNSLKFLEKMIYALGAITLGGFGLVVYLIKG